MPGAFGQCEHAREELVSQRLAIADRLGPEMALDPRERAAFVERTVHGVAAARPVVDRQRALAIVAPVGGERGQVFRHHGEQLARRRAADRPVVSALLGMGRVRHVEIERVGDREDHVPPQVRVPMRGSRTAAGQRAPDVGLDAIGQLRRIDVRQAVAPCRGDHAAIGHHLRHARDEIAAEILDLRRAFAAGEEFPADR